MKLKLLSAFLLLIMSVGSYASVTARDLPQDVRNEINQSDDNLAVIRRICEWWENKGSKYTCMDQRGTSSNCYKGGPYYDYYTHGEYVACLKHEDMVKNRAVCEQVKKYADAGFNNFGCKPAGPDGKTTHSSYNVEIRHNSGKAFLYRSQHTKQTDSTYSVSNLLENSCTDISSELDMTLEESAVSNSQITCKFEKSISSAKHEFTVKFKRPANSVCNVAGVRAICKTHTHLCVEKLKDVRVAVGREGYTRDMIDANKLTESAISGLDIDKKKCHEDEAYAKEVLRTKFYKCSTDKTPQKSNCACRVVSFKHDLLRQRGFNGSLSVGSKKWEWLWCEKDKSECTLFDKCFAK